MFSCRIVGKPWGMPTMSYKSVHTGLGAVNAGPFLETLFLEIWQQNVGAVKRKVVTELNIKLT